jgi:hypothetical protein
MIRVSCTDGSEAIDITTAILALMCGQLLISQKEIMPVQGELNVRRTYDFILGLFVVNSNNIPVCTIRH